MASYMDINWHEGALWGVGKPYMGVLFLLLFLLFTQIITFIDVNWLLIRACSLVFWVTAGMRLWADGGVQRPELGYLSLATDILINWLHLSSIEFYVCLMHAVECCTYLCRLSCLSQKCFICLGILFYQWVQVGWTWLSSTCCHLRWMPLSWMVFLSFEAVPCCNTWHTGWGYQRQSDCIFLDVTCHLPACVLCAAKALNQWGRRPHWYRGLGESGGR